MGRSEALAVSGDGILPEKRSLRRVSEWGLVEVELALAGHT